MYATLFPPEPMSGIQFFNLNNPILSYAKKILAWFSGNWLVEEND